MLEQEGLLKIGIAAMPFITTKFGWKMIEPRKLQRVLLN
jgi:hypothetical protein